MNVKDLIFSYVSAKDKETSIEGEKTNTSVVSFHCAWKKAVVDAPISKYKLEEDSRRVDGTKMDELNSTYTFHDALDDNEDKTLLPAD
jgi:hypothetical protein